MPILSLTNVSKRFGATSVLRDLTLNVPEGALYGFVGANGAGKTTTMKLILGLDTCDAGTITVADTPVHYGRTTANQGIAYLPDVPAYDEDLSPSEYLTLCGRIAGVPRADLMPRVTAMLKQVDLPTSRRRIHGFSRGMRQRLGIAQALLTRPRLLLCDEPTSALDPAGRRELLDLLASLRGQTTVLFSTHILSDVERICDRVGILHDGHLAVEGTLTDLRQQYAHDRLELQFSTPEGAQAAGRALNGAVQGTTVTLTATEAPQTVMRQTLRTLVAQDLTPQAVTHAETTLEEIFMEVTQ
ncbi:ABC transporter ATP-binding protein [Lacticaseibacillus absianus]|uniref:ABC transporter ATP-binding protein n=1 Tax=Lacticaseibacillus absianus TaxID=2729623 RepID=UPI0015C915D8|nr:ABC transporter ATP-binding protein [Lacticaseibacillus absianus]